MSAAKTYLNAAIDALLALNPDTLTSAADACAKAIAQDGLIYIFGTGHSHMLAEEGHYRAGGLAAVVPILPTAVMLHESAVLGGAIERLPGMAATVLARYPIGARDVMVIVSNSGVNAAPVEAAHYGKARGATVISLSSERYSRQAAKGRVRIADIADIALDTGLPPGDSVVPVGDLRCGPLSTVVGAALLNAVFVEATVLLQVRGIVPPVYISSNMPGAAEHNARLIERYRPRNPHL